MTEFKRSAEAKWDGDLTKGQGKIELGSGAYSGPYSFNSRFGDEKATNPEELLGASHAGCFTMALSAALTRGGTPPAHIETKATVTIAKDGEGFTISGIELITKASVPKLSAAEFAKIAEDAKATCPISRALSAVKVTLNATLLEESKV